MFRPLWAILRSQKSIVRKAIQHKNISCVTYSELSTRPHCHDVYPYWTNKKFDKHRTSRTRCICTLTLSTVLVKLIISSIWINRMTMRSRWKFRICTTTNALILYSFPHYIFLWPEDGPQWAKHVVSLIKTYKGSCVLTYVPPSKKRRNLFEEYIQAVFVSCLLQNWMDYLVHLLAELVVTSKRTVTLSELLLTPRRAKVLKSNVKEPNPCRECSFS